MNISITLPMCGMVTEPAVYSPRVDSAFFYPRLEDDNSTVNSEGLPLSEQENITPRYDPHRNVHYGHGFYDQRVMTNHHRGFFRQPLSPGAMYDALVIGKPTVNHMVGPNAQSPRIRALTPSNIPLVNSDSDLSMNSDFVSPKHQDNHPSFTRQTIAKNDRSVSGRPHTSEEPTFDTRLAASGRQTPNHHLRAETSIQRKLSTRTVAIADSYGASSGGGTYSVESSCFSESASPTQDSRRTRVKEVGPERIEDGTPRDSKARAPPTNKKMWPLTKISCAAESIERDWFTVGDTLLGQPIEALDSHDTYDDSDAESYMPKSRLYADMRKRRLRNQFLSYERDTLNQQLEKRVQEIEKMKQHIQDQDIRTKELEEQVLKKSEKIAEMMNGLIENPADVH